MPRVQKESVSALVVVAGLIGLPIVIGRETSRWMFLLWIHPCTWWCCASLPCVAARRHGTGAGEKVVRGSPASRLPQEGA
jgi:hypothetical protein